MFIAVIQTIAALAVTLGLFGLAVYAGRRWGPSNLFQFKRGADKRMAVVESLVLDAQRRLVLIRIDQEERLLLLGEGRLIDPPAAAPKPRTKA